MTTKTLSERLRDRSNAKSWADADAIMDEAADELDRLRAENARLLADAQRYRWLRDEAFIFCDFT